MMLRPLLEELAQVGHIRHGAFGGISKVEIKPPLFIISALAVHAPIHYLICGIGDREDGVGSE